MSRTVTAPILTIEYESPLAILATLYPRFNRTVVKLGPSLI